MGLRTNENYFYSVFSKKKDGKSLQVQKKAVPLHSHSGECFLQLTL